MCTYPIFEENNSLEILDLSECQLRSYPYGCPLREFHFERDQFWKLSNLVQCEETAMKECAIQGVMFEEVASGQGMGFKSVFVWQSICWYVPWE